MALKPKVTVAVVSGIAVLGAGLGIAGYAYADPTPSANPSTSAAPNPGEPAPGGERGFGHRFGRHHGPFVGDQAKKLAEKLGVTEDKVAEALRNFREANRPARLDPGELPKDQAERQAALAKSLAKDLSLDEAKVKAALEELRAERLKERAAAVADRLKTAVSDGTLTQAEADAVTKAIEKGVIGGGPR